MQAGPMALQQHAACTNRNTIQKIPPRYLYGQL
jgi:hypothetical protein